MRIALWLTFILAATVGLWQWYGWWALTLPAGCLVPELFYRRRLHHLRPGQLVLWEVDLDGSYYYYVFATSADEALVVLAKLHLSKLRPTASDWLHHMRRTEQVEEIEVTKVEPNRTMSLTLDAALGGVGQTRVGPGLVTLRVRDWARYWTEPGIFTEIDW